MGEQTRWADLLAGYRTALLTTVGADGRLRSRPMAMREEVRGEEIWFATSIRGTKCRDLEADARCNLTFFDAADGTTVSVAGRGEVIRDRKLVRGLWGRGWSRWFPAGPDARDVALVRVIPEQVERHDGATGAATVLYDRDARATPRRRASGPRRGRSAPSPRSRRPASRTSSPASRGRSRSSP